MHTQPTNTLPILLLPSYNHLHTLTLFLSFPHAQPRNTSTLYIATLYTTTLYTTDNSSPNREATQGGVSQGHATHAMRGGMASATPTLP